MSLTIALEQLNHMPHEFIGNKLKSMLQWQRSKGHNIMYNLGWYVRWMNVDWGEEAQTRRTREAKGREGKPGSIGDTINKLMGA